MGELVIGTGWQNYFRGCPTLRQSELPGSGTTSAVKKMSWEDPQTQKTIQLTSVRDQAALRFMTHCLHRLDPKTMEPIVKGTWLKGYALSDFIEKIHCPVLLLQGDPDNGGTLLDDDVSLFCDQVEHVVVKTFPGAGHLLHQLRLTEILQTIPLFLESI
ncbi:MAG: hypothetical protein R3C11_02690 [Planctomycetaceae bacterium]